MSDSIRIIEALRQIISIVESIRKLSRALPAEEHRVKKIRCESYSITTLAAGSLELMQAVSARPQPGVAIVPHPLDPSAYTLYLASISRIIGKYPTEADARRAADLNGFHTI